MTRPHRSSCRSCPTATPAWLAGRCDDHLVARPRPRRASSARWPARRRPRCSSAGTTSACRSATSSRSVAVGQRPPRRGGARAGRARGAAGPPAAHRPRPRPRACYEVLAAVEAEPLDAVTRRMLEKSLLDFRRSGVDRDERGPRTAAHLAERQTETGQQFSKNIRDGVGRLAGRSRAARRSAGGLRRRPSAGRGRAGRADHRVPRLRAGDDLRRGPRRCARSAHRVPEPRLAARTTRCCTSCSSVRRETARAPRLRRLALLRRRGQDDRHRAGHRGVHRPDRRTGRGVGRARTTRVLLERLRAGPTRRRPASTASTRRSTPRWCAASGSTSTPRRCAATSTSPRCVAGLLDVTGRLFGLDYAEPAPDAPGRWHDDVTGVRRPSEPGSCSAGSTSTCTRGRGSTPTPRSSTSSTGVAGAQLPEGVLVCNFPRGLMEHDDVVTLFHEFGHLVHHVLGGSQRWARFSGVATEWDFVEAPSQMLEEWAWDHARAGALRHRRRRAPDPRRAGGADARGRRVRQGLPRAHPDVLRRASPTACTARCPTTSPPRCASCRSRYDLFGHVPGTHFHASFGHLGGYSSAYYTYMWSLVIAKDLFSAFDRDDLFAARRGAALPRPGARARAARHDAADLVADFLGRPYGFDAFEAWLAS